MFEARSIAQEKLLAAIYGFACKDENKIKLWRRIWVT